MTRFTLLLACSAISSALISIPALAQTASQPAETGRANAPDQKPAFENQTRAPQPASMPKIATEVVADDLPHLWAMEFLPDGRMLVTAKQGAMHIISEE